MPQNVTYVQDLCSTMHAVMEQDPSVVVLGEDILDPYGGTFKVTRGLSTRFLSRVLTTPICEATIVGMAVGLALRGQRPVAELMFGDFLTLGVDQLINHAAKFRAMYNGQVDVPLVIRTPMGGGRGYGPTHSQSLERLMLGIPHLKVVAPSHLHRVGEALRMAINDRDPVLFVENKLLYPQSLLLGPVLDGLERDEIDGATGYPCIIVRNHQASVRPDVTVIAYGGISRLLPDVLARLRREEIWVVACLPACLSPAPIETLVDAARETKRVVIVEEGYDAFGWGAEIASHISAELHGELHGPIRRMGAQQTVIPASKTLEDEVLVSERAIESAILEAIRW